MVHFSKKRREKVSLPSAYDADAGDEAINDVRGRARKCKIPTALKEWFSHPDNKFLAAMISSMLLGALVGCVFKFGCGVSSPRAAKFIGFPGQIWMASLRCMIIPLITVTIVMAVMKQKQASATGRLSVIVVAYYLLTTAFAAALGTVFAVVIQPGTFGSSDGKEFKGAVTLPFVDTIFDLIRNLFPDNLFDATIAQKRSVYKENVVNATESDIVVVRTEGMNIMGLMMLSTLIALVIKNIPSKQVLDNLIQAMYEVIVKVMHYLKLFTPIGLFFLIVQRVIEMKDLSGGMVSLSIYLGAYVAALLLHAFVFLLAIFFAITRRNILIFLKASLPALVTAFGTSSSAATMPVTRLCVVEDLKVPQSIADFTIPIGTTINMDGAAIYQSSAAIFIAQFNGIPLDFGRVLTIVFAACAFSVGAAGVPSAGLISLQMVLQSVSLPLHDVPLLVAVEWFTDRCLTTVNVLGDIYSCCIVAKLYKMIWKDDSLGNEKEEESGACDLNLASSTQL